MSQRIQTLCAGGIAAVCLLIAIGFVPALVGGRDVRPDVQPPGKLIVHEWGTFTNFSGSDGVNLDFRPLGFDNLPSFVVKSGPAGLFAKREILAQQRMETPVTYFYTAVPRTVNVRVDFPQGRLTDWYPDATTPLGDKDFAVDSGRTFLDWGEVRLTPQKDFDKLQVRTPKGIRLARLPNVTAGHHYGEARETDSAIVEKVFANGQSHFEKFLFYRGLGNFDLPMKLEALGGDRFEVTNSGAEASGSLLLVRIENEQVRFARYAAVGSNESLELSLPTRTSTVEELAEAMTKELTAAGLYQKEALAMVNTWRTSWFGEEGSRLLYLVPEQQTNQLLPLAIEPAPDECVRILVGRLETLTPEDCQRLVEIVTTADAASEKVQGELKALGRFAEPAIQFALRQEQVPARRERLEAVLATLRPPKPQLSSRPSDSWARPRAFLSNQDG